MFVILCCFGVLNDVYILHITIPEMHHNIMSTGSDLWHFLNRLIHKFLQSAVSSEKEVATTKFVLAETGTGRHVIMMHFGKGDKANICHSVTSRIRPRRTISQAAVCLLVVNNVRLQNIRSPAIKFNIKDHPTTTPDPYRSAQGKSQNRWRIGNGFHTQHRPTRSWFYYI